MKALITNFKADPDSAVFLEVEYETSKKYITVGFTILPGDNIKKLVDYVEHNRHIDIDTSENSIISYTLDLPFDVEYSGVRNIWIANKEE